MSDDAKKDPPPDEGGGKKPKRYRLDAPHWLGKGKGLRAAGEIIEYSGKPGRYMTEVDKKGDPVASRDEPKDSKF